MGKFLFFVFGIFGLVLFFSPQKVRAAELGDVIINEVMWMGSSKSSADEWIELRNMSNNTIVFSANPWSIYKNNILMLVIDNGNLDPGGYFLISNYNLSNSVLNIDPDLVTTAVSLSNSNAQYKLYDSPDNLGNLIDMADDGVGNPAAGEYIADSKWSSMERNLIPGDGTQTSNWHTAIKSEGFDIGATEQGTPGAENSVAKPPPLPLAPTGAFPEDYDTIPFTDKIVFKWETTDTNPQSFEFILSTNLDLTDFIYDEDLAGLEYEATNLVAGDYYWQVIASNTAGETASPKYKFTIYNPVYSNAIIINELMPDPDGDEVKNEWIELYNNSDEAVDLNGWQLADLKGSIHKFTIFNIGGTIIEPRGYLVFYRSKTGITLNNDQDGARLYQPNGNLLYETSIFADGEEDWSWARTSSGKWSWTENPTPAKTNIIYLSPEEDDNNGMGGAEETIVLNTVPIGIKTGEFRNFEQYLVAVTGTVISTSGNTFYLDDGSGQAKIYIQDKTGIDKPPMHKGDLFEVIGIVDLYRSTWRILPQKQSDIKLLHCIKDDQAEAETTTKTSSSSASSKSTAGKTTAQARAPTTSLVKEVKAAENTSDDKTDVKSSFWLQILEALTGLAIIFLILLIIKIRRFPKVKVIGGHFGEDET